MVNTRIGLAVLATSSLVAAGAGGFLATRYNATPAAHTAVAGPAESEKEAVKPPDPAQPVEETEAVMDDGVAAPETATNSAPTSAPARIPAAQAARGTAATQPAREAEQRKAGATTNRRATVNEHPAPPAPRAAAASRQSARTSAEEA